MSKTVTKSIVFTIELDQPHKFTQQVIEDLFYALAAQAEGISGHTFLSLDGEQMFVTSIAKDTCDACGGVNGGHYFGC